MKRTTAILLCTFLFGGMLSGCSNSNTDPQTETTTETEQTDTLASTEEETADSTESSTNSETSTAGTGTFDWDTAMSQATLDGKAIPMPFTVNDLGEEYYVDEPGIMYDDFFTNDGCVTGLYNSDDDKVAFLEFYHVLTEDYTNDCPVGYIGHFDGLSIQGVQVDTPMEQVYETWGQPNKRGSAPSAYYYSSPDKCIIVYYDDDRVTSMDIYFEYQETEESK